MSPTLVAQSTLAIPDALEAVFLAVFRWLAVGGCATVVGAAIGAIVVAAGVRRRHLFWISPVAAAVVVGAIWIFASGGPGSPGLEGDRLSWILADLVVAALGGFVAAAVTAPLVTLMRIASNPSDPTEEDTLEIERLTERPAATTPWPAFREGFFAPWEGFLYLCHRPRLIKYGIAPVVVNLGLTLFALVALLATATGLVTWAHGFYPAGWGWEILEAVVAVGLCVVAFAVTFVVWRLLEGILCGYFHSILARHVELRLGTREDELREASFAVQTLDVLLDAGALIVVNGLLLLLNVIPVIGSAAAAAGGLWFNCRQSGQEYLDYPLQLRGMRCADRRAFSRKRHAHTLGLGAAALLFGFIPLLGPIVLTTATVGAVLLHRRLRGMEEQRTPLDRSLQAAVASSVAE